MPFEIFNTESAALVPFPMRSQVDESMDVVGLLGLHDGLEQSHNVGAK